MYRVVIQLKKCDSEWGEEGKIIHEVKNPIVPTIKEALEWVDTGKQMFEIYSEIENSLKSSFTDNQT